ncbi:hypothetical protein IMG5_133480 [Ichthyophthirius multifiliis]|uniref:Tubulin/FtsZ GTPase domain-containing protein n=1 Tax=Ichthyophthirius multifiliis TaxID=5932 RepID=G0QWM2_ICHMU|nr:hypothetical protein IMG5_133480 [Ichthyophthirius multifiliis]EGR30381.1 hypothetical protein IMG5_133480 [Ichthyophthirius multifiliis]|eukprot:XP_004031968.1 hypothetical protein IMG5_133480 [Ichthyophthirius multifiliis]
MTRELITIQVGQCGNQIGTKFWELALKEHAKFNKQNIYDDALSTFFRNLKKNKELQPGSEIHNLKARVIKQKNKKIIQQKAIVIDMEERVINEIIKSDIGELFDQRQVINDVGGAGNNWAHGYFFYGQKYKNDILDKISKAVEQCDSLQCFFLMHSLGGGTGSGLGTFLLKLLKDEFPDVYRFTASVFPQKDDDVVTSPYNSLFSLYELSQHADCVFPIDNQALLNICQQTEKDNKEKKVLGEKKQKPFDKMNNIVANLLSNVTCSMRFEGILNVDLNEITMNLVPYPDLHFLVSSMAPLYSVQQQNMQPKKLDQMFKDIYHPDYQLINVNPYINKYLAVGLIVRGSVSFSDVNRNIKLMRKNLDMIYWNQEGFKYGICNAPPVDQVFQNNIQLYFLFLSFQPYSVLCMANNTSIRETFQEILERFNKLYRKKVYIHHYTQYMDAQLFNEASEEAYQRRLQKEEQQQNEGIQQEKHKMHKIGSIKNNKVNFDRDEQFFAQEDIPIQAIEKKIKIKEFINPDLLNLRKKEWNTSVAVPKNPLLEETHERKLIKIKLGLFDRPIPKLKDKYIEIGTDSRNDYLGWNVSTEQDKNFRLQKLDELQNIKLILFIQFFIQKSTQKAKDKNKEKENLHLKEYRNPNQQQNDIVDHLRETKKNEREFRNQIRKEYIFQNPGASQEKVDGAVFRLTYEAKLRKNQINQDTSENLNATQPYQPTLYKPDVEKNIKRYHTGVYQEFTIGKDKEGNPKVKQCWSCCMNTNKENEGCNKYMIDRKKWSYVSYVS